VNTFTQVLEHAVQCHSSVTAVVDGERRMTYGELGERVERLMTALTDLGVSKGDRVAALAQNGIAYTELYFACPMLGAILVPLNTRLTPHELHEILDDCDPVLLLTDWDLSVADTLASSGIPVVALDAAFGDIVTTAAPMSGVPDVDENAVATLMYTGGTTGRSKGVMLTHRNRIADAESMIIATRLRRGDVWLNSSPVFHTAGSLCILPCTWVGATLVIHQGFDPARFIETVSNESVTMSFTVPKMLQDIVQLLEVGDPRIASLRFLGHGAAPITTTQLEAAVERMPNVQIAAMYGATELSPMATLFNDQGNHRSSERFRSCGLPMIGVAVAVIDDLGQPVDNGVVGEITARGPNVMKGYWNRPEETAAALIDGWYRTGDLGYRDDDGYVYVVDRKKDMIISGGENVYSLEVETAIAQFPGVVEVAVFGVSDDTWGEAVAAVVVADDPIDVDDLRAHCRSILAGYKVPRRIDVRQSALPRTPAGKVLKRDLRTAAEQSTQSLA
jgi:long-chain acyl-CoA synthetase